jgi:hypothetical protein
MPLSGHRPASGLMVPGDGDSRLLQTTIEENIRGYKQSALYLVLIRASVGRPRRNLDRVGLNILTLIAVGCALGA